MSDVTIYDVQDIDIAFKLMLERVSPLSDGVAVPVYFEVQPAEDGNQRFPAISVRLVGMTPNADAYIGLPTESVGFVYGRDGNPTHEIEEVQPEHYSLVYDVSAYSVNPIHDRELGLKIALTLGRAPVLRLSHIPGKPSLQGYQQFFNDYPPDAFNFQGDKTDHEERVYHKVWTFTVECDLYSPNSSLTKVSKEIVWNSDDPSGTLQQGHPLVVDEPE